MKMFMKDLLRVRVLIMDSPTTPPSLLPWERFVQRGSPGLVAFGAPACQLQSILAYVIGHGFLIRDDEGLY